MTITAKSVADVGLVLRAVRRSSKVRLDDLAETVGVSKQFVSDVERGKPTVRLGLVFALLAELGIPLNLDIPEAANAELTRLRDKGVRPYQRRVSLSVNEPKKKRD